MCDLVPRTCQSGKGRKLFALKIKVERELDEKGE
jgi:hypothetical protein